MVVFSYIYYSNICKTTLIVRSDNDICVTARIWCLIIIMIIIIIIIKSTHIGGGGGGKKSQLNSVQFKNFNHPTRGSFVVVMAGS